MEESRIAAGVAAIALSCSARVRGEGRRGWITRCRRKAGEWRSVPLSDGSSITAAPYTKLRHDIGDEQRLITLAQGRAMFRVAKDPSRPFLVEAGGVIVTATGTQFTVERQGEKVTVTMREGSVVVSPSAGAAATFDNVTLVTDQQLTISGPGAPAVEHVDGEELRRMDAGPADLPAGSTRSGMPPPSSTGTTTSRSSSTR